MKVESEVPRSIDEVPLLRTTLKIMKFWSFLLAHTWRRYISIGPYAIINMTEFLDLFISHESVDAFVRNAYITVLFFNTILRAVLLCWQRFDYEKFMEELRILYVELMNFKDDAIDDMLDETNKLAVKIAKLNLAIGIMGCFGFFTYPIFADSRVLPFGIYIPGIDKYASPYYEILFTLQILMSPCGFSMYIPYTNLYVAFVLFGILMARVLQHKLLALNEMPKLRVQSELIWCIRYHMKFLRYVHFVNKLVTYMHLIEFLFFGAMLCVMLFLFIIVETMGQQIIIVVFLCMIFGQSVVIYYCANELHDQSLAIAVAAYDCNWFDFDVETQKHLRFLLQRAQQPCSVLIGNVYVMNLEMLQSLLNATYTYFTLLKRVYDPLTSLSLLLMQSQLHIPTVFRNYSHMEC